MKCPRCDGLDAMIAASNRSTWRVASMNPWAGSQLIATDEWRRYYRAVDASPQLRGTADDTVSAMATVLEQAHGALTDAASAAWDAGAN